MCLRVVGFTLVSRSIVSCMPHLVPPCSVGWLYILVACVYLYLLVLVVVGASPESQEVPWFS